jgi:hypothetical protein
MLLDLINNGLVLQNRTVVCEVDFGGLFGKLDNSATGVLIALLEGLKGGDSLASKTKRRCNFGPVELERCTSLERRYILAMIGREGDESIGRALWSETASAPLTSTTIASTQQLEGQLNDRTYSGCHYDEVGTIESGDLEETEVVGCRQN